MAKFTDEEAALLRDWLIERSGKVSDAEPDVLADYILALLKNNVEGEELVKLLKAELADFLDDSESFSREIVAALETKEYSKKAAAAAEEAKKKAQEEAIRLTTQFFKPDVTSYNQAAPDYKRRMKRGGPGRQVSALEKQQQEQNRPARPTPEESNARRAKEADHLHAVASDKMVPRGTSIIVSNLPLDKLDDASIRTYFTRFGEIVNVTLNKEFRTADIEFSEPKAAKKAWSNPAPIFDNRFIKVFFKKPKPEVKPLNIEEIKSQQLQKQREFEEKMAKKAERDAKLRQLIEIKEKMRKDLQDELELLDNKNKETPDDPTVTARVETIQKLIVENRLTNEDIEADKAKLEGRPPTSHAPFPPRGRGAFRGRAIRGRGRGGSFAPYTAPPTRSLDLRTKTLTITNLADPENESFKRALSVFGMHNIEEVKAKDSSSVNVTFKQRYLAEKFLKEKVELEGMPPLEKVWDESVRPTPPPTATASSSTTAETSVDVDNGAMDEREDVAVC